MDAFPLPNGFEVTKTGDYAATITIEPLSPGYGVTIGNALRRVLLSSLSGTAVTSVKVSGVEHEFSAIDGVKEDMVEIMLNLKQLHIEMLTEEPQILKLSANKEGAVTAAAFEDTADAKIVNKDLVIAHITDSKTTLEMEIMVERGRGYLQVEQRRDEELGVGVIAVDALFSPVVKVGYDIENMRVGQRTDFDRLMIHVETDGSVTPENAFEQAARLLMDHYAVLMGDAQSEAKPMAQLQAEEAPQEEIIDEMVTALGFSTRTANALSRAGIERMSQLVKLADEDLLALEGFGQTALQEVRAKIGPAVEM